MTRPDPPRIGYRLSRKKLRDVKGEDKEETVGPIQEKLFGNAQIEDYDTGYVTIRDGSQKLNFVSYAYGQEVMRGDEWGFIDPPQPPRRSASVRRYHQVKRSVAESTKSLALILEQAAHLPVGKRDQKGLERKEAAICEHSPAIVYGRLPTKMERVLEKSATLANIVDSVKRLKFRKKPPHKVWDSRGQEPIYLNESKYVEIGQWTDGQIAEYHEHNLVALTTRQLKQLQGKSTDTITYANPVYIVPPSTPTGSEFGDDEEDEGDVFGRLEDEDPKAEHKYLHKDLRNLLGPYTGFHIAPGTGCAKIFERTNNRSAYYGMPLIEKGRHHKRELVGFVNMIDQEFERFTAMENGEYEIEDEGEDFDSNASSDYDQTQNVLHRPRSQLAGQALIQYLLFSGHSIDNVAKLLAPLDKKFLYESESRWWRNCRVPQHTQLTDKIVEKVLEVAKADKEWWGEEKDKDGLMKGKRMPKEQVLLQMRQREKGVKVLAKKSVENYLWWRLRGEQPHWDCKSGPMMRKGEY